MPDPTVAASFVRGLFDFAVAKGADRRELAARAGVDPAGLQDRDARIPLARYVALMRAGKELCHDPALALHFGEEVDLAELTIVGMTGGAAGTMAEGIAELNRQAPLAIDYDGLADERMQLRTVGGELWVIDARPDPNDFPELTESFFARAVTTIRRHLGGRTIVVRVHVTHAEPPYRAEYDRIFGVPVVFGSDENALVLPAGFWPAAKAAVPAGPAADVLKSHAEGLLARLQDSKTMRGRVERLLMPILQTGEASMDVIAAKLGVSRQTLFRRLKAEGTTFARVLDELRHRMALHYLDTRKTSVNETAYLLGFSDPAAFSRAFKRWTGTSPAHRGGETP